MCEIFPEVQTCFTILSIRLGMLFIAILSIATGAITLGVTEKAANYGINKVVSVYNNVTNITKPEEALSGLSGIVTTSICAMSLIFMMAGVCLLISTFVDQEGYAQAFIWLIMLNILIGLLLILAITCECLTRSKCYLGDMDWLSGAMILITIVFYLILWYYFACVANTYVLNRNT